MAGRKGEQHVAQTKLIKYINKMFDCTLAFGLSLALACTSSPLAEPPMNVFAMPPSKAPFDTLA